MQEVDHVVYPLHRGRELECELLCSHVFFFQAEDGIRDFDCDWSSDVCSSDLTSLGDDSYARRELPFLQSHDSVRGRRSRTRRRAHRLQEHHHVGEILGRFTWPLENRDPPRSEERRVGKEGSSRWSQYDEKKNR